MRTPRFLLAFSVLCLISLAAAAAPTAILVDTSRSVSKWQFQAAVNETSEILPQLVSEGEVALYVFNDEPSQITGFTKDAARLEADLKAIQQGGNFTLLYDCLYAAVKDLEKKGKGGRVLLVSDGLDENSAVTLEDACTRASEAGVAVVPVGMGSPVQAKILRRVAALTDGQYAGDWPNVERAAVVEAFQKSVAAPPKAAPAAPARAAAPVTAPGPAAAPVQPEAAAPVKAPPSMQAPMGLPWWVVIGLLCVILFMLIVFILLFLKRTSRETGDGRTCEKCGRELRVWEDECPECLAKKLSLTKPGLDDTVIDDEPAEKIPEIDPALLRKAPSTESLENTLVLDEVPILVLQRGRGPARVFQLPADQVVSVGRDKVNTISVADPTLSGQHFRIIPKDNVYYLVDLKSTNGTLVNGERASIKALNVGSVIHAGQCDFTFKREQRRLNQPPPPKS